MKHPIANRKFKDSMAFLESAAQESKGPLTEGDKMTLLGRIEDAFNEILRKHKTGSAADSVFRFADAAFKFNSGNSSVVMYDVTLVVKQYGFSLLSLYAILDALTLNEEYPKMRGIEINKYSFMLGDGDDTGAVRLNGKGKEWYDVPKSITFWVRHFG